MTTPTDTYSADKPPSLAVRLTALAISSLLALGAAEGVVRWSDGNGFPQLGIFGTRADGRIVLRASAQQRIWRAGATYDVSTDALGLRAAAGARRERAETGWLVLGDSQVLGMGVPWSDTFTARSAEAHVPLLNAGVPGYGVEDSLAQGEDLLRTLRPSGVVIVVNQANDWEEWGRPVGERYRERAGWLVQAADAGTWRGTFLTTPLSRMHVLFYAMQFLERPAMGDGGASGDTGAPVAPAWMASPESMGPATTGIAAAAQSFAEAHPDLRTLVCFLPVDFATSAERARRSPFAPAIPKGTQPWLDHTLRDGLAREMDARRMAFIDLTAPLSERADMFLDDDYHLSARGHAAVAAALDSRLPAMGPREEGSVRRTSTEGRPLRVRPDFRPRSETQS